MENSNKQIFILSGQSNMAGRGGVTPHKKWDQFVPPECQPDPNILRFSANLHWEEACEPLHADIDNKKPCGIGPGLPFAKSIRTQDPKIGIVGLVPCAVGGTAIKEWERGCHLYDEMVKRAKESIKEGGEIRAVLWYQGESDTLHQHDADTYKINMERLIVNVRSDLGLPSLPFIQVAIASGDERLMEKIREAQFGIDLPNVVCVDAKGLELKYDNLHLTTEAQLKLGNMLADVYLEKFSAAPTPLIHEISKCFIKPARSIPEEESKAPIYLSSWDLTLLTGRYIQTGLLFSKPPSSPPSDDDHEHNMNTIIDTLKDSLSKVLVHFYPLTGRLKTHKQDSSSSYYIYLDCSNPPQGAEFVHASTDLTLDDILSPIHVPAIVPSFFLYNGAVNHDGHTLPLLGVQITELIDGYFIGCSFNHVVGDGTSFWHFLNSWSEISRSKGTIDSISNPPILKRWFLDGNDQIINLPYSTPEDFIDRSTPKSIIGRVFHFSAQSMSRLKSKANEASNIKTISSFQSLCALIWRAVTRVCGFHSNEISRCVIIMGGRARLVPPISNRYFGNCVGSGIGTAEVGELLSRDLGWSALLCNEAINNDYNNEVVRKKVEEWIQTPVIRNVGRNIRSGRFLLIGFSRFDVYGNDFGWGKPVATRRGTEFDGRISAFPGVEGGGSIDLICWFSPQIMSGLDSDQEFMSFVSPTATVEKKL